MRTVRLLIFLVLGSSSIISTAQHEFSVTDSSGMPLLGRFMSVYHEESVILTVEDILATEPSERLTVDVPNFGLAGNATWVRVPFQNNSSSEELFVSMPHPEIEWIDAHLLVNDDVIESSMLGQAQRTKIGAEDDIDHVFAIHVPLGSTAELLIRIQSQKQLQLPLSIGTAQAFSNQRSNRDTIIGLYMGIMLVLLLYNIFIFSSIRDRSYGVYVLYLSLVALTQGTFLGLNQYYVWPESYWIATNASMILTVLTAIAANEFMNSFIQVRLHLPKVHAFRNVIYVILATALLARVTYWPLVGYNMIQMFVGFLAIYQLIISAILVRRGSRTAGFFLLAWSVFLVGIVVFILKDFNILPYNNLTKYTMPLGSAVEGVLLSFGLADRINTLRKEKELSQAQALAASMDNERIIREQNVVLDFKVKERTQALEESNEDLKRTQSKLVDAEKMASLGQLTAGIAHEINNPVNFITSNIKPLRRNLSEVVELFQAYRSLGLDDPRFNELADRAKDMEVDLAITELDEILHSIEEGASRTAEIVRGLRNFSRLDEDDLKYADINEGLRNTLTVLGPQLRDLVRLDLDLGELPSVECYPGKLNQVFMNILTNAIQATSTVGKEREPRIEMTTKEENGTVLIEIADNGPGMKEEVRKRIFEPFFTTKDVGEGTGLGLSIAYSIIEKHFGTIEVESEEGIGTIFRVILPMHQATNIEKRA